MIFILGGTGFVGSAFSRYCEKESIDYKSITRANYKKYRGQPCDILINCNGNSKKFLAVEQELIEFDATVKSVKASLLDFRCDRYVLISSGDVYPNISSPETTQEKSSINVEGQSNYGFHKYLAELCVQHAAKNWLIFRMGGFVGPGLKKNAIFDILSGGVLWLKPESKLQYMHIDAAVNIVFDLLKRRVNRGSFNLCGDGVVCLQEVINWAGRSANLVKRPSFVHFEIALEKIKKYVDLPESGVTVKAFVKSVLNGDIKIGSDAAS